MRNVIEVMDLGSRQEESSTYVGISPREALVSATLLREHRASSLSDRKVRDETRRRIARGARTGSLAIGDLAVSGHVVTRYELGVMRQAALALKSLYRRMGSMDRLVLDLIEPDTSWSGAAKEGNFSVEQVFVNGPGKPVALEREGRELHAQVTSMLALGLDGHPFVETGDTSREAFEFLPGPRETRVDPAGNSRQSLIRSLSEWGPVWRAKRLSVDRKTVMGADAEELSHALFGPAWDERARLLRELYREPLGYSDPMLSDQTYERVVVFPVNYSEEFPEQTFPADGEVQAYSITLEHEGFARKNWFDVQPDDVGAGATQEDVRLEALRIADRLACTLNVPVVDLAQSREHVTRDSSSSGRGYPRG